jgi:hypothetical protein
MGATAAVATLIGQPEALAARIARLLRPLPPTASGEEPPYHIVAGGLATVWALAIALGLVCGEPLIGSLLALSY